MVKILHELGNLDGGGVARLLYDYYRNMDREKVHFDFVISDEYENGILEAPLKEMGSVIYKIPFYQTDKDAFKSKINDIIRDGGYDIVHCHRTAGSELHVLKAAKKHGVKKVIVHSHLAANGESLKRRLKTRLWRTLFNRCSVERFACGTDAGIAMWGKRALNGGKVRIMTNAVDTEAFRFSEELRREKRTELGVEDKFVMGLVGRLCDQKNQTFLLRACAELFKTRDDAVLLLAGRGDREEEIKKLASELNITDKVMFLGVRADVSQLLNAFDCFLLPSIYEGFPVVMVEAQANGLTGLMADTITSEVLLTDLTEVLPIYPKEGAEEPEKLWARKIDGLKTSTRGRGGYAEKIAAAGYDIKLESLRMQDYYINCLKA